MSTPSSSPANSTTPSAGNSEKRARILTTLGIVVALGLAYGAYDWWSGRHVENTDDAYVQGNMVQITPQVGGTVTGIYADDTDYVKAGQPLVQLDPADARVALDQARANLAQAVRQVRTLYANNTSLASQITLREAEVARARTEVARAEQDLQRRQSISGEGAVSREELAHAQSQLTQAQDVLTAAQAAVVSARDQLRSNQTLTDGIRLENHPTVLAAAARLRETYLALHRAALPAPVDGYVARRSVQLGQRVAAGSPLMALVPLQQVWVDANFKEVQLRNIRIGQPVTLTADLYGKDVQYKGKVAGLGVGTGAAFSLLPAQNATGNWIKVVQRVPVRVTLDPQQLREHPLRMGLSMLADVDTTDQSGKSLAQAPAANSTEQTDVFAGMDKGADDEVRRIIAANAGEAHTGAAVKPAALKHH